MALIAWPVELPQYPHHEYELVPVSGVTSPDDQQSPRRIRTYPEWEGVFTFTFLNAVQQRVIRHFYTTTLNQQAPFTAAWLQCIGLENHFCRFAGNDGSLLLRSRGRTRADAVVRCLIIAGVPVDPVTGDILYGGN